MRRFESLLNLMPPDAVVLGVGRGADVVRVLPAAGVRVVTEMDDSAEEQRSAISVVTMPHVLQHLVDPCANLWGSVHNACDTRRQNTEVPSSKDHRLTVFPSSAFLANSYWFHRAPTRQAQS